MVSLTLTGLRHSLGGRTILDGLSLHLETGELHALVGPSGSGKTTLLRLVAGLDRPDAGRICLGDTDATSLPPERRGVAMVFQQPLLFPHMTVADNVGFGLRMQKRPAAEARLRTAEALARVQMDSLAARYPAELSGGQQQRVALARALVLRPRLLLLDEPFSHLDPGLRDEMHALLRELHARSGITALLVTHDLDEALTLADRLVVLLDGRIRQTGRPAEVLAHPASRAAARFLQAGALVAGRVERSLFASPLGGGAMPPAPRPWPDGPAWAVLPPAALRMIPPGLGVPAEVTRVYTTRQGPVTELVAGGCRLKAAGFPPVTGPVHLTWDSRSVWYVYE